MALVELAQLPVWFSDRTVCLRFVFEGQRITDCQLRLLYVDEQGDAGECTFAMRCDFSVEDPALSTAPPTYG